MHVCVCVFESGFPSQLPLFLVRLEENYYNFKFLLSFVKYKKYILCLYYFYDYDYDYFYRHYFL